MATESKSSEPIFIQTLIASCTIIASYFRTGSINEQATDAVAVKLKVYIQLHQQNLYTKAIVS